MDTGDTYTKEEGVHDSYDRDDYGELYDMEECPTLFHIGSFSDDEPAKKLSCKKCGSDQFSVGKGKYYTAIKCRNCHWERCVHDG